MLQSQNKTILEAVGRKPIHPFPARMAPGIALDAIGDKGKSLRVLDPMTGSGTVVAVARAKGHQAIGVDIDPLAVLLAGVWTRSIDPGEVNDKAEQVLDKAKAAFSSLKSGGAYPIGSDEETQKFIRYWFDDYARRQLTVLSNTIRRVQDEATRNALWCGFSRLIITKSAGASRAMDLAHSRPHRVFDYAPVKPFNRFLSAVKTVVSNCPHSGAKDIGPTAIVKQGDARNLKVASNSIDLVLTSPPYLNAIDYIRCSKFSLVWMGHTVEELRQIRSGSVGSEAPSEQSLDADWVKALIKQLHLRPTLSPRNKALLSQYVWDMGGAFKEVSRVLRTGGKAVYVVGDSTVRGTFIRNSSIVAAVAEEHGLRLKSEDVRILPANRRYLPPPKKGSSAKPLDARMRHEVVLVFDKKAS
jgi:DNA modification methylase